MLILEIQCIAGYTEQMIIIISLATFLSAMFGGLFALQFKDKLHLILGFAAGAIIGVVFFDILPEAINLGRVFFDVDTITMMVAVGFLFYLILDRFLVLHTHSEEDGEQNHKGILGAGSILLHSFLDGAAVGLAFQISLEASAIVAVAVITHRFSDGVNAVSIILKDGGSRKRAFSWLVAVSVSPVLGILSSFAFSLPEYALAPLLALFAGFFLYIGASDLLPESHHRHPTGLTTLSAIIGMAVIYAVVKIAHI